MIHPKAIRNREAASFISGLPTRSILMKFNVWKPADDRIMSIVNGFSMGGGSGFTYEDRWNESENFIKWDGSFAYAICVYEKYLSSLK